MFVTSVKRIASGVAFAVLALTVGAKANSAYADQPNGHHYENNCSDGFSCPGGQAGIFPYEINPYQIYETVQDGVHYFKGGSGLGYGYPYYGNLHINNFDARLDARFYNSH